MLGHRDVSWTVVSIIIGAGIFFTPGEMVALGAQPITVLVLFALGGILALFGALVYSELASHHPGNGGPMRYLENEIGRTPALVFNWVRFWAIQTAVLAIMAIMCAKFLFAMVGASNQYWEAVLAIVILFSVAMWNMLGLTVGVVVQRVLTWTKILTLAAIAFAVVLVTRPTSFAPVEPVENPASFASLFFLAIFAYGGWAQATMLAGDAKEPQKFARSMTIGIIIATAIYLVSLAAMLTVTIDPAGPPAVLQIADQTIGIPGMIFASGVIALTILGSIHSITITGAKLYEASANRSLFFATFAKTNEKMAPAHGYWFQALWASLLVAFSVVAFTGLLILLGVAQLLLWAFHGLTVVAWFKARANKRGGQFRTPGGPTMALTFLLGCAAIVVTALWAAVTAGTLANPDVMILAASLLAIGLGLLYARLSAKRRQAADS